MVRKLIALCAAVLVCGAAPEAAAAPRHHHRHGVHGVATERFAYYWIRVDARHHWSAHFYVNCPRAAAQWLPGSGVIDGYGDDQEGRQVLHEEFDDVRRVVSWHRYPAGRYEFTIQSGCRWALTVPHGVRLRERLRFGMV